MQCLEVSVAVQPIYGSLGFKQLRMHGHTNVKFGESREFSTQLHKFLCEI